MVQNREIGELGHMCRIFGYPVSRYFVSIFASTFALKSTRCSGWISGRRVYKNNDKIYNTPDYALPYQLCPVGNIITL